MYHNVDISSDHSLVVSKLRLKLSARAKKKVQPRIDVSSIKSAADKTAFQLDLQNRFEALAGLDTVNEEGNVFANAVQSLRLVSYDQSNGGSRWTCWTLSNNVAVRRARRAGETASTTTC